MPWKMEERFRVVLGGNTYINTHTLIAYKGEPLFTIKRRDSDQILGIDFDIFDQSGKRAATVRNGNVVQGNEVDYKIIRDADHYRVIHRETNRVICDIRKKGEAKAAELEVSVDMYTPSGFRFQATPIGTNLPGQNFISGGTFENCGCGIAIN
jgi:hypothetical protein